MENGPFEYVFPIEDGDIPASYVSLPEGSQPKKKWDKFGNSPTLLFGSKNANFGWSKKKHVEVGSSCWPNWIER